MSKTCAKCGEPLPRGTDVCPNCAQTQENDAALFTMMTSETEAWNNTEPVKPRRRRSPKARGRRSLVLGSALLLLLIAVGVLLLVFRPAARVTRAIRGGEIQRAYELYWSSGSLAGNRVGSIDKAIMAAADEICTRFANHEIDADTAASQLSMLGGFGDGAAEMLSETYALFRSFTSSHSHMVEGEKLFSAGEYLTAREEFLQVEEVDASYAAAQTRIGDCLTRYGETVAGDALRSMDSSDYPQAIAALKEGNSTLVALGTFSEAIDSTLLQCYDAYETYLLAEADRLWTQEEYDAAVELLETAMAEFPSAREPLTDCLEESQQRALDKHLADAAGEADALYAQGDYAGAFAVLEDIRDAAEENRAGAQEQIAALEARFAEEICSQARACYGGVRDALPDAIAMLDEALATRDLEPIRVCREDLAQYLPLSLVTAEYSSKDGAVFRIDSTFEGLDGSKFSDGWLWGENNGYITFALDGAYDVFTCNFATRRNDSANANGQFELWCDGEKVYTADKLYHWQKESRSITVDISGCKELRIVFLCDYTVSTAENGYCYHGICNPFLTRNIPAE